MSQQLLECPLYIMHGWKKWALKFHLGISHRLRTESDFAFNHQDSGDCAASSINDCKKKTCMEHCQNLSITLHVMMSLGISYLTYPSSWLLLRVSASEKQFPVAAGSWDFFPNQILKEET